jgi:hypothetical protein
MWDSFLSLVVLPIIKSGVDNPSILIWTFYLKVCTENGCLNEEFTESILRIHTLAYKKQKKRTKKKKEKIRVPISTIFRYLVEIDILINFFLYI